jgi:hypothetical protein
MANLPVTVGSILLPILVIVAISALLPLFAPIERLALRRIFPNCAGRRKLCAAP